MSSNNQKQTSRGDMAHAQNKDAMFISRRDSESPVKSLIVFQENRKLSHSSNNLSKKSSYSDLDSDEVNIHLETFDRGRNYSSMV